MIKGIGKAAALAVAVATDDADTVTFGDPDGNVAEHDFCGIFEMEGLAPKQVGHVPSVRVFLVRTVPCAVELEAEAPQQRGEAFALGAGEH